MTADALVSPTRVLALLRKEAQDLLRSRAAVLPGLMTLLAWRCRSSSPSACRSSPANRSAVTTT